MISGNGYSNSNQSIMKNASGRWFCTGPCKCTVFLCLHHICSMHYFNLWGTSCMFLFATRLQTSWHTHSFIEPPYEVLCCKTTLTRQYKALVCSTLPDPCDLLHPHSFNKVKQNGAATRRCILKRLYHKMDLAFASFPFTRKPICWEHCFGGLLGLNTDVCNICIGTSIFIEQKGISLLVQDLSIL
jgi:hypothetical protein